MPRKIAVPKASPSDQIRRLLRTPEDATQFLGPGAAETIGPFASGGLVPFGSGYEMVGGMVASDQPFTVTIRQGASAANQDLCRVIASALDPVSALQTLLIRWPIGGEYITVAITNTGALQTIYRRTLYLMPIGNGWLPGFFPGAPLFIQGPDAVGVVPVFNPFCGAGVDAAGILRRLEFASRGTTAPTYGNLPFYRYDAVPVAVATGQTAPAQGTAYGREESAAFSRASGADQVLEIAPIEYDVAVSTARASAALAAAGAYDAAPIEVSTGLRRYLFILNTYTRGVVGGAAAHRIQIALTVAGVNTWVMPTMIASGGIAPGADSTMQSQRIQPYRYDSTSAIAESYWYLFDIGRAPLFRIASAEIGVIATPGVLATLYQVLN